ncbi:MAG: DciA family protein [Pyrinomonadaceae bacterium]
MEDLLRAIPSLLRAAGEAEEVVEAAAFVAWRRAAGDQLRGQAVPFRLFRKTLVVAVADHTWQKQLERISSQMLFRLNSLLGHPLVTFIEFRIDPDTVNKERARLRQHVLDREAQQQRALSHARPLGPAASQIKDEALRRRFLLAAGSYLDAKDRNK